MMEHTTPKLPSDEDITALAIRVPYTVAHLRWIADASGITDIQRLEEVAHWYTAFGGWIETDALAEMMERGTPFARAHDAKTYAEAVADMQKQVDALYASTGIPKWLGGVVGWLASIGETYLYWCERLLLMLGWKKNSLK